MHRRDFLRLSTFSLGAGALLRFAPDARAASFFHHHNGETPRAFSFVQLSATHVGYNGPPDPLGTAAFDRAVETINALDPQPDFDLFTGDLTHDSEDAAGHAK